MSNVTLAAAEYRAASAELADITNELAVAQRVVHELEERQRKATMRRTEAQRLLLEAAKI